MGGQIYPRRRIYQGEIWIVTEQRVRRHRERVRPRRDGDIEHSGKVEPVVLIGVLYPVNPGVDWFLVENRTGTGNCASGATCQTARAKEFVTRMKA